MAKKEACALSVGSQDRTQAIIKDFRVCKALRTRTASCEPFAKCGSYEGSGLPTAVSVLLTDGEVETRVTEYLFQGQH